MLLGRQRTNETGHERNCCVCLFAEEKTKCSMNDIACIQRCTEFGNCSCPPGTAMGPDGQTCVGKSGTLSAQWFARFSSQTSLRYSC